MKTIAVAVLAAMIAGPAWAQCAGTMQFGCNQEDSAAATASKEEVAVSVLCSPNKGETDEAKARIDKLCVDAKAALAKTRPAAGLTSAPTLSAHNP